MSHTGQKRKVDSAALTQWVEDGAKVLDLGCGRGVMLHDLRLSKGVWGVGVDLDPRKILGCVKRGVPAYQGDIEAVMRTFEDGFFDWVICSRTLQELASPQRVIKEALRVGQRVAVGFVNYGFWRNRLALALRGRRVLNEVYPEPWYKSRAAHAISIDEFESFCAAEGMTINRRMLLGGDWQEEQTFLPGLLAGYAIYDISR